MQVAAASASGPAAGPVTGPGGVAPVADHGGSLALAERRFGRPALPWIDLSTGINPWHYPLPPLPPECWTRLPDRDAFDALLAAAAACYGVPDARFLVAGPGSQSLIQCLPRLLPRGRVAVVGPTYAEHARCWRLAGHDVSEVAGLPDAGAAPEHDVVVVVNPNNPDGRRVDPGLLRRLAAAMASTGGLLVVDEAFADVDPAISMAPDAGMPGLCVLRSFGKFYGLAGLRLGFALGPPELAGRIEDDLGPWAVPGPALSIGRAALEDRAWAEGMRADLGRAAARLDGLLAARGLEVVGGTSLYRLVRDRRAGKLYEAMARRGILARPFDARPDWLRFGLPPGEEAEARLAEALAEA